MAGIRTQTPSFQCERYTICATEAVKQKKLKYKLTRYHKHTKYKFSYIINIASVKFPISLA